MLRISLRYLRSKSSHSVVNLISRVALFAIATPVAAVIILLSVFNGFGKIVEDMASSIDAPITVQSRNGRLFEVERVDTAAIRSIRGVEALSLGLEQSVLLRRAGRERVITMRGVEPSYAQISNIAENITLGAEHTQWGDYDRLLVGGSVAHELGVNSIKGSRVEVYSIRRNAITSILPTSSYRHKEIDITGLFSLDVESESKYAITSLRFTQELFQAPGSATQLFVAIDKDTSLAEVKSLIEEVVGEEFSVKDRYQMNPTLYSIIKGEKRAIILIAIFVMILASFTLIGALVMQILDKRGEFTPLRAMGASRGYIRAIFIRCGVVLSMVATLAGGVVGVVFSLLQEWFGFIKIPAAGFIMDRYPVNLQALDVVMVIAISLLISALLSYLVVRLSIKNVN